MKPYYEEKDIIIYCGDCFEIIPEIDFSIVIADPPYMFGMGSVSGGGNSKLSKFADLLNGSFFFREIISVCFKKMPENSAMWMFTSWRSLPVMMKGAIDANRGLESCLVWDKDWIGPGGPIGLRPSYEMVVLITGGNFALPNRGIPDILKVPWSSIKPTGHPAEKPVDLLRKLIKETPGETILDPFMGSGTTLRAAKDLGRKCIGIEIEEKYCQIAVERLRQGVLL